VKIGGGSVALVLLVGGAFLAGKSVVDSPAGLAVSGSTATTTTTTVPAAELLEFRDEANGWAISYPKSWNRLQPKEAAVSLVVSEQPAERNTGGSILARGVTLAAPVTESNLATAREVTDGIVAGDGIRHVTEPKMLSQAGLPGYFYFYAFTDPASGQEGVHSHYFLFKGSTMISFVFQALPKEDFQRLAGLFDQVIGSFRML
jgi:hypothetical protein